MNSSIDWIVGASIGISSILIGAFSKMSWKNAQNFRDVHTRIDQVKDTYVKEDHLNQRLEQVQSSIHELSKTVQENNKELNRKSEKVLEAILEMKARE